MLSSRLQAEDDFDKNEFDLAQIMICNNIPQ